MPGRTRTTKGLAGRIQWAYYKKAFTIPRWRTLLSRGFLVVGLVWVAWYALARNSTIYSSGPLTKAHESLGKDCGSCHNQELGTAKTVTDPKCLSCHDGPVHSVRQVSTPACSSCHLEHRGSEVLLDSSNEACVNCHSELRVNSGTPTVAVAIKSFTDGHPEFSSATAKDPEGIKFNHKVHLKKQLRGLTGNVEMACTDCHKTVAPEISDVAFSPRPTRAYMVPVNYEAECSKCHPLEFDKRIAGVVPHKKLEVVHDFLVGQFTSYIAAHPEELRSRPDLERIPRESMERVAKNAQEWVAFRVADSERLLENKTCVECHRLTPTASLPNVIPANITTRWLTKGSFNHSAHVGSQCTVCHAKALASEKASDVLIPGISTCQECHNDSWSHKGFDAGAKCLECHQYHDWNKEKDVRRTIAGL